MGQIGGADHLCLRSHRQGPQPTRTSVAEEAFGGLLLGWGDQRPHQVVGKRDHDDEEEEHLGLGGKAPGGQTGRPHLLREPRGKEFA